MTEPSALTPEQLEARVLQALTGTDAFYHEAKLCLRALRDRASERDQAVQALADDERRYTNEVTLAAEVERDQAIQSRDEWKQLADDWDKEAHAQEAERHKAVERADRLAAALEQAKSRFEAYTAKDVRDNFESAAADALQIIDDALAASQETQTRCPRCGSSKTPPSGQPCDHPFHQ